MSFSKFPTTLFFFIGLQSLLWGCGAPLKSADDVKHIFSDTEKVQDKVFSLCNALQARQQAPTLVGVSLADDSCSNPVSNAVNYSELQRSLNFTRFLSEPITTNTDEPLLKIRTRSELWLNRSLVQLAGVIFNGLESETDEVVGAGGQSQSQNKDFNIQIIGKPTFNAENFEFQVDFSLASTVQQNGVVDIDNTMTTRGKMFDNKYFAATSETVQDQPKEKSVIKNAKFMIIIVPHAGDVFLDITTETNFHSFGVDNAFESEIRSALAKGLKSIPDLLAKLEQSQ